MAKCPLPPASMCGPDFPPPCQAVPSCPTLMRRGWKVEAFQAGMAMSHTGRPPPWGLPLPILGHLTSTSLTPKLQKGEFKSLGLRMVLQGPSLAPHHPQWDARAAPTLGLCAPILHQHGEAASTAGGCWGRWAHWWHGMGFTQTNATPAQPGTGDRSPSLWHRVGPYFSHSSRLSPQQAGWPLATS